MEKHGCSAKQIAEAVKAAESEREETVLARREKARVKKQAQRLAQKLKKNNDAVPATIGDDEGQSGTPGDNPLAYKDNSRADAVVPVGDLQSPPVSLKTKPTVLQKSDPCLEILTECLSEQTARDLIAHRKTIKSAISEGAARGLVKKFKASGDPESAASDYMANGYKGFFPKNGDARAGPNPIKKSNNPMMKRLINGELEHRAKINGSGNGIGLLDLEILRGNQEPPMLDGPSFDAGDDAETRRR